ncbi:conserved hypothetical protein [Vibrio crassostreae]|uniref:Uncharacterized protein n=1 Tax=Vibrio crassostreae TaxID=246167 RepID=A0ABM9QMS4_9VIBR|nr:hypothetical protein EDB52_101197 [Vibrio crassostreae]TCT53935.1 hypothetical protein EDB39_1011006 [Vibrio crassostreae]TCT62399.1 hypothetical protein EDB40_102453 [Vibrio crassostreae]CAK1826604.1 conserved hypothetical protein [Vibrio crassostreae]CAK1836948.1 conserved hypothetical protein [Vibrio crassostreae]
MAEFKLDKNKESPLPENHITPELFVQHAWDMDFRISAADSAVIHSDFIKHASILADKEGIDVHYLDFSEYDTAAAALSAKENSGFLEALEDGSKKSLLWFVNCDSLAPLNVAVTYSLRTALTTRQTNKTQSVFIATKASLLMMFANREAPFYQSHFRLTGYSS